MLNQKIEKEVEEANEHRETEQTGMIALKVSMSITSEKISMHSIKK